MMTGNYEGEGLWYAGVVAWNQLTSAAEVMVVTLSSDQQDIGKTAI